MRLFSMGCSAVSHNRYKPDAQTREVGAETVENDCSHVVFEALAHIRESVPEVTCQSVWVFRRLPRTSNRRPQNTVSKPYRLTWAYVEAVLGLWDHLSSCPATTSIASSKTAL